jgi:hypothetical protein
MCHILMMFDEIMDDKNDYRLTFKEGNLKSHLNFFLSEENNLKKKKRKKNKAKQKT